MFKAYRWAGSESVEMYQEDELDFFGLSSGLGIFLFPQGESLGQRSAFSCHLLLISFKFLLWIK
jgi:hypothetical protein